MADFLLELRCEEIPARMQPKAKEDLARLFADAMAKAGLPVGEIETFATPRRLALIAKDLPLATEAVSEETKGPKVGAPPQALEGFLRKVGLTAEQMTERDGVYFAVVEKPGRDTAAVLAETIPAIIRAFPWPKSMRWGAASLSTESLRWVRPLSEIIALLDDAVVPCEIDGIASGRTTMGHRFHHSGPVDIANAGAYVEALRAAHVIVHFSERCKLIRDGAAKVAAEAGLTLVADEGLVTENAGLTEWPVPLLGRFDEAFLDVPPEVIQLTARVNQKYFVCQTPDGSLANAFVCTANIDAVDPAVVVDGNRKVLAARLSDARFFWEQDQKTSLEEHAKKLARITFHEKLGTVADKVERVAKLARWLCEEGIVKPTSVRVERSRDTQDGLSTSLEANGDQVSKLADMAEQAARLCKADLVTEMVGEFPELQGLMGGYYAAKEGLPQEVAEAIRDHYKPVGQGDDVPTAPVTVAVSLADKLDTLFSFFGVGELPTGSKDPFALRRAAIAVIRLIEANSARCLISEVARAWGSDGKTGPGLQVEDFLHDRLGVMMRDNNVRYDIVQASTSLGTRLDGDVWRVRRRAEALQAFVTTEDGANLLAGYKRAANILKKEDWRGIEGEISQTGEEDPLAMVDDPDLAPVIAAKMAERHAAESHLSYTPEPAEKALIDALDAAAPRAAAAVEAEQFADAMAALATLRAPIDRFFEDVIVNAEEAEKRSSRLALLARFRDAVHRVADFSRIEG
ncbi:MAG: glycine--tRNA ligase subunit beta [Erythrobacter sp.]